MKEAKTKLNKLRNLYKKNKLRIRARHLTIFLKVAFVGDKLFLSLKPEALKIMPTNA